jgi:hypothetical protein
MTCAANCGKNCSDGEATLMIRNLSRSGGGKRVSSFVTFQGLGMI